MVSLSGTVRPYMEKLKHVAPVGTYLSLFSIVPKISFTEIEDGTSLGR